MNQNSQARRPSNGGSFDQNDDGEEDDGIPADTVAVVLLDRGTGCIDVYPKGSKSTEHIVEAFQNLAGAKDKVTSLYCGTAPELKAAARQCAWRISAATTGQPQANGVAERSVRTVTEGGRLWHGAIGSPTQVVEPSGKRVFPENTAMLAGDA